MQVHGYYLTILEILNESFMYLPFHSPPMPLVEPVSSPLPKAPNISLVVDLKLNKLPS